MGTETTYDHNGMKEVVKDMTAHRKLIVDTIRWQLEKLNPKKYGNKIDVTTKDKELPSAQPVWNFIDANKTKE